jgi:hypothetical protein
VKTFGEKVLQFYKNLEIKESLPKGIEILNPYHDKHTFQFCIEFCKTFYNDTNTRIAILGINPGRFGGGITGIPFTDPIKLERFCGIKNDLPKKAELSADFIHMMMESLGGLNSFYSKFFFSSVSPLGFTISNKNLNYYDNPRLQKKLEPFILRSLKQILKLGVTNERAFCLGEGTNYKYLQRLNEREKFFNEIIPLPHPRFIMQYKRKHVKDYIERYRKLLSSPHGQENVA